MDVTADAMTGATEDVILFGLFSFSFAAAAADSAMAAVMMAAETTVTLFGLSFFFAAVAAMASALADAANTYWHFRTIFLFLRGSFRCPFYLLKKPIHCRF